MMWCSKCTELWVAVSHVFLVWPHAAVSLKRHFLENLNIMLVNYYFPPISSYLKGKSSVNIHVFFLQRIYQLHDELLYAVSKCSILAGRGKNVKKLTLNNMTSSNTRFWLDEIKKSSRKFQSMGIEYYLNIDDWWRLDGLEVNEIVSIAPWRVQRWVLSLARNENFCKF